MGFRGGTEWHVVGSIREGIVCGLGRSQIDSVRTVSIQIQLKE